MKQSTGSKASSALFLSLDFYITHTVHVPCVFPCIQSMYLQVSFSLAPMFLSILEWHFSENNNNNNISLNINYLITQWNFSSAVSTMEQSLLAVFKV